MRMAQMNDDDHPFPFMLQGGGTPRRENAVPSSSRNLPLCMEELPFLMPYGFQHSYQINPTHQASFAQWFFYLEMAQSIEDHSFPFMQVQRPANEVGTSSSSRTLHDSSEEQSLASQMEALNLSNLDGFHDYETSQYHEDWLQLMRNTENVNTRVSMHQSHLPHPIAGVLGPGSREKMAWPRTHYNPEHLQGHCVLMAKDPRGSRLLQQKIDQATPQENFQIVKELKYHLHELIKHPYGNFVILKLFQSRNISVVQKDTCIFLITVNQPKLKDLCIHDLGSRVIQQILENEQVLGVINLITHAMRCITVALMINFNGGYVIQQCLKLFPSEHKNAILEVVAQNCYDIAVNRCGCCNIQKCIQHDDVPAFYDLVDNLILNAEDLAKDQYGNYVMQYLVKRKILEVNAMLVLELRNKYVGLSTNKYASNVVEDLLHYSRTENVAIIVEEIMKSPNFLQVVQHQYGNYVVQRALQFTEGSLHESLCDIILSNHSKLNSCLHGKKVLHVAVKGRRVRRLENNI
ncbi:hypothetical protein VNO80_16921 [Phaseolus coccineus]|uniref:PUM-HD domain-containing protein n=1 Tax=Phaseolus coccineus TaxID=3886 RepID=A0AAN9MPH2_PHACN